MNLLRRRLQEAWTMFKTDSLFRNAVFLMISTGIMSVLGFGFWAFVARLYSPEQIGLATALIAVTLLIANLSFLGLNAGLLRFLPTSKRPSGQINAAIVVVVCISLLGAAIYLMTGHGMKGTLAIFTSSLLGQVTFVLLVAAVSLNILTDSIFIANRRAHLHTIVYAIFGTIRLILPLLLIKFGSLGIFTAYTAAVVVSLALSLVFMWRYCGYRLLTRPDWSFIAKSGRYARNNYAATLLAGLPVQLMPALIIGRLGDAYAAYFSMAYAIATLLYVIPSAITNSLVAESSHDITKKSRNIRHASKILATVLIPTVAVAIIAAPHLLQLFGQQYTTGALTIFELLAVAALCVAGNAVGMAIMNVEHRSGGIVITQAVIATVTLGAALPLMSLGLTGVGIAMLGGQAAGNIALLILFTLHRRRTADDHLRQPAQPPTDILKSLLSHYGLANAKTTSTLAGIGAATLIVSQGKQKYVLKAYQAPKRSKSDLMAEHQFTQYLRSRNVPVARFINNQQNQAVTELTTPTDTWLAVLMPFETGNHPTDYSSNLLKNMAQIQAQIHLGGLTYAATGQPQPTRPRTITSRLLTAAPKAISHFDYDGSNILVQDDQITCVLDFEGMRYDPLVVCLYFTLTRLYDDTRQITTLETYLRAYQTVRPLGLFERFVLKSALALRLATRPVRKSITPDQPGHRR